MKKKINLKTFILSFFILFLFWIIFSGKFDSFHLFLGVISCCIVSFFASDLLFSTDSNNKIANLPELWLGFAGYIPWLIWQVILANIHMLFIVLSPNMKNRINPKLIKFRSRIKDRVGLVTFANSITLTPGTITVKLSIIGDFVVHAIDDESAASLPGAMEDKVAKIFGE